MFKSTYAIVAAVAIAVLSIVVAIWNAARPDRSASGGRTTYGTRAHGNRGVFEVLQELGVPADRSFLPPHGNMQPGQVLAMIDSDPVHVSVEPEYLFQLREWVEKGGSTVIALKSPRAVSRYENSPYDEEVTLLQALGLEDQRLVEIKPQTLPIHNQPRKKLIETDFGELKSLFRRRDLGATTLTRTAAVENAPFSSIMKVAVPSEDLQVFDSPATATAPIAALQLVSEDGLNYTLAAVFPKGSGRIVVLTDSELLHNRALAREDNAVLAWELLGKGRQPVVFDEFYHGLTVAGNPFWLLTRPAYGFAAGMIALAIVVWLWRHAIPLGPPLPESGTPPRTIRDYLDAVSRMFLRARARRFLLEETWTGALWILRKQLHPGRMQSTPQELLAILERRDPQRATRFHEVTAEVDTLLQQKSVTNEELRRVTQRIKECL